MDKDHLLDYSTFRSDSIHIRGKRLRDTCSSSKGLQALLFTLLAFDSVLREGPVLVPQSKCPTAPRGVECVRVCVCVCVCVYM